MADKVILVEEYGCHEFTCGDHHGNVRAVESRKSQQPPYETRPAHICVMFINDRAWRDVRVFGTKSLKKAVQAAMVYADPKPVPQLINGQEWFGETKEVTIPKKGS